MQSVLNKTVSCFENCKTTVQKPVNLLTWLTSDKYRPLVEAVRAASTKEERSALKKKLPAITVSGLFTLRKTSGLVQHSGLICLDIDRDQNQHIENWQELPKHLAKIQNIAYIGRSCSGSGYYCIVPISEPENHKRHFEALQNDLLAFGLNIDKACSDVCRLRFYSFDDQAYFNHQATVYSKLHTQPPAYKPQTTTATRTNGKPLDRAIKLVLQSSDGEKHGSLYKASLLAGGYIAGGQLSENEAFESLQAAIRAKTNVRSLSDATKTIRDGLRDGKMRPILTV